MGAEDKRRGKRGARMDLALGASPEKRRTGRAGEGRGAIWVYLYKIQRAVKRAELVEGGGAVL